MFINNKLNILFNNSNYIELGIFNNSLDFTKYLICQEDISYT